MSPWADHRVQLGHRKGTLRPMKGTGKSLPLVPHFTDYIGLLTASNPGPIDVIANGLGAVVLLDSGTRLSLTASGKKLFGQLILLSFRMSTRLCLREVNRLVRLAEHITVLVSPNSQGHAGGNVARRCAESCSAPTCSPRSMISIPSCYLVKTIPVRLLRFWRRS